MSHYIHIDIHSTDFHNGPDYEAKEHPSGFTEYYRKSRVDNLPKDYIDSIGFIREFSVSIYSSDHGFFKTWNEHLKKLFEFFKNVDAKKIENLMEGCNCFSSLFGIFQETKDNFSDEEFLNKFQNYFYIQVPESNSLALYTKDFRKRLAEKGITTNFDYCDTTETVFLFKDLEFGTINTAIDNILELRAIDNEMEMEKRTVVDKYYDMNSPWLRIK